MKGWKCNNCGHNHVATDNLEELGFTWLGEWTNKTSCQNCGSYTIQRPYTWDQDEIPIAGEFLLVRTYNRIRKGN